MERTGPVYAQHCSMRARQRWSGLHGGLGLGSSGVVAATSGLGDGEETTHPWKTPAPLQTTPTPAGCHAMTLLRQVDRRPAQPPRAQRLASTPAARRFRSRSRALAAVPSCGRHHGGRQKRRGHTAAEKVVTTRGLHAAAVGETQECSCV
jgi:hypothetical protein